MANSLLCTLPVLLYSNWQDFQQQKMCESYRPSGQRLAELKRHCWIVVHSWNCMHNSEEVVETVRSICSVTTLTSTRCRRSRCILKFATRRRSYRMLRMSQWCLTNPSLSLFHIYTFHFPEIPCCLPHCKCVWGLVVMHHSMSIPRASRWCSFCLGQSEDK